MVSEVMPLKLYREISLHLFEAAHGEGNLLGDLRMFLSPLALLDVSVFNPEYGELQIQSTFILC